MKSNRQKTWKFRDLIALLVLCLAVLLLFIPALRGQLGIFHDDQAMAEFPWHFFLAECFQSGEIPLWEPDIWCGAIPFYAEYYSDTWYFPLWPFYLLTDIHDLDQAYLLLSLLPLILHYLLAVSGMYFFCRQAIGLRTAGSFIGAWGYLFSPAFSYSYVWFPIVNIQSWLPWFLTIVVMMDRGFGFWRIAGGGGIIALMIFAGQPPQVGYTILLGGLLALALGVHRLRKERGLKFLRAPLQFVLAGLLGIVLSAVFWLTVLEGAAHTEQHIPMTYEAMTGGEGSLPPLYLATLFVPDLFGTVTGLNNHNWTEAVTHGIRFWDANLSGGILLSFLVVVGAYLAFRLRRFRFWTIFAGLLWMFSIFCVLGRHTPFYNLFFSYVPVLPFFPFPIRYRLLQVIATAWLAGLGMGLITDRKNYYTRYSARLVWGYMGLASLVCFLALTGFGGMGEGTGEKSFLPGIAEIIRMDNLNWFITGPVFYFLGAAFCLVLAWRGLRGRRRAVMVAGLVLAETGILAAATFYFCFSRFHEPQPQQERSLSPTEHPMIQRILGPLSVLRKDQSLRWATDQPFYDNFARFDTKGSWAFMGYDMKPLEKRFKTAFETAYKQPVDWPIYWEFPRPLSGAFLSNMSVGYLIDSYPGNLFPGGNTIQLGENPSFYFHKNPRPLPRAFTMDRVITCSDEEALSQLVEGDLRQAVFIENNNQVSLLENNGLSVTDSSNFSPEDSSAADDYFQKFQIANPVVSLELNNPNRIEALVQLSQPAILILTEIWYPGWKAEVDGHPAEILRVNYLQRGVPLPEGEHHVKLVFLPRSWLIGITVSSTAWTILLLACLLLWIRRLKANRRIRQSGPRLEKIKETNEIDC